MFEAALGSAQLFLAGRERAKTTLVTIINEMRVAVREYGRRLAERGVIDRLEKVFMATDSELDRLRHSPETIVPTLDARWEQFQGLFERKPVFVVNGRVPDLSEMTRVTTRPSPASWARC